MAPYIVSTRLARGLSLAAVLLLCLGAMTAPTGRARAQTAAALPPAAVAPLVAPPTTRIQPAPQPQIAPPPAPPREAPVVPPAGPPVRVDQVRVEGVTVYSAASLQPLYADVIGKPVPRARFDQIVQAVQTRYRLDGYILTLVRGEFVKDGTRLVFVIRAIEGFIGDVKLEGDIGPAGDLVLRMLQHLLDVRPVNNRDLERWLLLANDIPGVSVRGVLRRQGSTPGAVELIAEVARRSVSGLLSFDNRGPPEAGPPEMLLSGSTNSYSNFGERLTALLFTTFNQEQLFGQVNGDTFIGSSGLQAHAYLGRGHSVPGGILTGTGFVGDIDIGGAALSYPFVRSRGLNFFSDLDFDFYHSVIALGGTAPNSGNLRIGRLGSHLDFQDAWLFGRLAASTLDLKLSHGLSGSIGPGLRVGADPAFTKLSGILTRVQDLFTVGDVRTALKASIGGQFTENVLPPSEKFFLGGTQFGRGFYNGEVTGDRAIGSSLELQINTGFTNLPLFNPGYRLPAQFYTFWDYGRGYNLAAPGQLPDQDFTIQSVGLGVRSDVTPWLFLELEGVHRLTVHPEGTAAAAEGEYAFFTRLTLHY